MFMMPGFHACVAVENPIFLKELKSMDLAALDNSGNYVLTLAGLLVAGIDDWQGCLGRCSTFQIQV